MRRRVSFQEVLKRHYARCLLCPESRYHALQCHRVVPGYLGGRYTWNNTIALCSSCHSLVTAGVIRVAHMRPASHAPWCVMVQQPPDMRPRWVAVRPYGF
jgi:hypothetical protein